MKIQTLHIEKLGFYSLGYNPFCGYDGVGCKLLKTQVINKTKTRAIQRWRFSFLVYNLKEFLITGNLKAKEKEAKYLFRMFTPLQSVFANITKKAKYLFWCFAPLQSVSINKKKTAFFSPLKHRKITQIII